MTVSSLFVFRLVFSFSLNLFRKMYWRRRNGLATFNYKWFCTFDPFLAVFGEVGWTSYGRFQIRNRVSSCGEQKWKEAHPWFFSLLKKKYNNKLDIQARDWRAHFWRIVQTRKKKKRTNIKNFFFNFFKEKRNKICLKGSAAKATYFWPPLFFFNCI